MRYRIIYFIICFFCLASFTRLIKLQIVDADYYYELSQKRMLKSSAARAPRGDITDRKGNVLVSSETGFSVQIHYVKGMSEENQNKIIAKLCKMAQEDEVNITDTFPVTDTMPFEFNAEKKKLAQWKNENDIGENETAYGVIKKYAKKYKISGYPEEICRRIIGVRYEMERVGFGQNTSYTFAEGVSDIMVTRLKEQKTDFPGVAIATTPIRVYPEGQLAAHVLGRVGKIYKEEYDELSKKGYSMNDIIGKQGIEKIMEEQLRGIEGTNRVEQSVDGTDVKILENEAPKQGNNVVLTIDSYLQKAAEDSLRDAINHVVENSADEGGKGYDAASGAIVAVDVNTGEILAMASYPGYNLNEFDKNYSQLYKDTRTPMFNRAIGGVYAPGSTFKMIPAIAALSEGIIDTDDVIVDTGVYQYFKDYQPVCWVYRNTGGGHGPQNVTQAIENSCNYFFYDIGRRVKIENINKYARLFGLGENTGIELSTEESTGVLAGPENSAKTGNEWHPGNTLQAAIGQSDYMFTPVQLANYVATLANGGTRYKLHLIKEIRSSKTGEIITEIKPEVLNKVELDSKNRKAVLMGMKNVVEMGTASSVFDGFDVPVGAKTGTAEVTGGSDNALFVAFAPFDKPTIAVCAVIEHGVHGTNAGYAVRGLLEAYFHAENESEVKLQKNVLTR